MATSPSSFEKQPSERYTVLLDFIKRLKTGEEIQSKEVVATYSGNDASDDVLDGSEINTDKDGINVGVKAGLTGRSYKITGKATTNLLTPDSNPYIHEGDITMSVIEE